eukprot:8456067-Pyramimonas_sp.AAC.1
MFHGDMHLISFRWQERRLLGLNGLALSHWWEQCWHMASRTSKYYDLAHSFGTGMAWVTHMVESSIRTWHIPHKLWNKLMHALHGNGKGGKGKGSSGKSDQHQSRWSSWNPFYPSNQGLSHRDREELDAYRREKAEEENEARIASGIQKAFWALL